MNSSLTTVVLFRRRTYRFVWQQITDRSPAGRGRRPVSFKHGTSKRLWWPIVSELCTAGWVPLSCSVLKNTQSQNVDELITSGMLMDSSRGSKAKWKEGNSYYACFLDDHFQDDNFLHFLLQHIGTEGKVICTSFGAPKPLCLTYNRQLWAYRDTICSSPINRPGENL